MARAMAHNEFGALLYRISLILTETLARVNR